MALAVRATTGIRRPGADFPLTQGLRCSKTIQLRHLAIHQDQIEILDRHEIEGQTPVGCRSYFKPGALQMRTGNNQIAFIILGDQHPATQTLALVP